MLWNPFLQLVFASGWLFAQTANAPPKVDAEELLSYECARSIGTLLMSSEQMGPLFVEGRLIFTSLEAADHSKMLLVNAGYGNYVVPLAGDGVNKIRFQLPTVEHGSKTGFFLSYMHGHMLRSRYFDYGEGHPPVGHEANDYSLVSPSRSEMMMPHLNYAIHQTAQQTLEAVTEGRIERQDLQHHRVENCDYISTRSPALARQLQHNLDTLDLIAGGAAPAAKRSPASFGEPRRMTDLAVKALSTRPEAR